MRERERGWHREREGVAERETGGIQFFYQNLFFNVCTNIKTINLNIYAIFFLFTRFFIFKR